MNMTQQVIILSAELSDKTNESNRQRSITLGGMLEDLGVNFSKAMGVYKGGQELSFVTLPKNDAEIEAIKSFAFDNFGQESILYQDANGMSYLVFANGTETKLGRLQEVNPKFIERLENYTILNGRVFTTEAV